MDKLLNEFTVNRPIDEAWAVLTDLEKIAPCMPGAQLTEIDGDVYRGLVKIKLGAISTNFKGQASFTERDDAAHQASLKAEGRDTGGKGNASATISARLTALDATSARCSVETDLHITGKVAQFGRGIMADVSKKLMGQFAANLNEMLDRPAAAGVPAGAAADVPAGAAAPADVAAQDVSSKVAVDAGETATPASEGNGAGTTAPAPANTPAPDSTTAAPSGARVVSGPAATPIDMGEIAGSAVLKRLLPLFGGLALLLFILRRRRH